MTKPYKSYEAQLAILESRGLCVSDREKALHALRHHSYYRLYNSLVLLAHTIAIIEPETDWPQRLRKHLASLPDEFLPEMGFPANWHERPIWVDPFALPRDEF